MQYYITQTGLEFLEERWGKRLSPENRAIRRTQARARRQGLHVDPESIRHGLSRAQGSQFAGTRKEQLKTALHQIHQTAGRHARGQVSVTTKHDKPVGTELVRPKSEIPQSDIVKTSTVQKPERDDMVDVPVVHTNNPESSYTTPHVTSIAPPANPQFQSPKPEPKWNPGTKASRKKLWRMTHGNAPAGTPTVVTQYPGRSAPRASQWGKSGHVVIKPR